MTTWKSITSIGAVGLAALLAFFMWRYFDLRSDKAALEWQLSVANADRDTIYITAQYSIPETTWLTKVLSKTDTVSRETSGEAPRIHGVIAFDTTKYFGTDNNPLSVRVTGQIHYPEEYTGKNWLLIVPKFNMSSNLNANLPQDRRSPVGISIGLCLLGSSSGDYGAGAGIRFKKASLSVYRQIPEKRYFFGIGYEILRF